MRRVLSIEILSLFFVFYIRSELFHFGYAHRIIGVSKCPWRKGVAPEGATHPRRENLATLSGKN